MSAASPPQESFDGPLDLLHDEVRRQKVAIEAVAIAPLVARYLDYLQSAAAHHLPLDIDWILLAATLIHWKSRSLLAGGREPEADSTCDELVGLLRSHRLQAAADLERRRSEGASRLSRGGDPDLHGGAPAEEDADPPFVSVWDLTQQARDLSRWTASRSQQRRQARAKVPLEDEDLTVAEMSEYLHAQLTASAGELDGSQLLTQQPSPLRRVYLFLALLEMARAQQLRIVQAEEFAVIWLAPPLPFPPGYEPDLAEISLLRSQR